MTERALRELVVATARAWLGRKESDGSHREIIDVYNTHKPLARGYPVKYTDAWCATFVSAVAIKLGLADILPTECGCGEMIKLYQGHPSSRWTEDESLVPEVGDVVFYDWDDSGTGDNVGAADHVGIIAAVNGSAITVIEGNYSNSVKERMIAVNGLYIRGYGRPAYAAKAKEAVDMDEVKLRALIREVVEEVLDERNPLYEDVTDVPEYWRPAALAMLDAGAINGGTTAEVNATDVNLRKETLKAAVVAVAYHDARERDTQRTE